MLFFFLAPALPPVNVHGTWAAAAFLLEPSSFYHCSDTWQKGPTFFPFTGRPVELQDAQSTNYIPQPSTGVRHQYKSLICSAVRVCSPAAKRLWIDCSIAQSTYCYSHPNHKKKKKTIWRGHAPVDINNWKISWSYQVYFRETRAIQWCSTHCYSETPLPSALWLLIKALLKFYQVTSCVQFIFLHSCKMW